MCRMPGTRRSPKLELGPGQLATRQASGQALQAIAAAVPNLVGGSADLGSSTGTTLKQGGTFGPTSAGRTFHWGVREHGMAACLNGIAAHGGLRPFGSTFLVFSDYMKPAIRLAAIMRLPIIYIGTHDRIGLGEDGPTHQPVEHLAMLRSIPNLVTLRPADATETIEAWRTVMARKDGPTMLVLSRQKLPVLDRAELGSARGVHQGAYVLWEASGTGAPETILIGTGSEVYVALSAARLLQKDGIRRTSRLDAILGAVRCPAGGVSSSRCSRQRSGPGSRWRPPVSSDGPAGSLTMGLRWDWKASEPQHRASASIRSSSSRRNMSLKRPGGSCPDRTTRATGKDDDR